MCEKEEGREGVEGGIYLEEIQKLVNSCAILA